VELRTIRPAERGAVLDLLAYWLDDRSFFARYFEHDPTFRDDLCFVAADRGRVVSTLQVFRKRVRLGSAIAEVAALGNVFTAADHRGRRLASQLIELACAAIERHGFDLSLLFATRLPFYARFGWQSHPRQFVFIDQARCGTAGPYLVRRFDAADLPAVMAVYDAYNATRSGTTVRDVAYWQGQLHYAGNPAEDFLVALDGERTVAYARGTTLYDFYVIMEHGCLPGYETALTQLVAELHCGPAGNLPGTITQLSAAPSVQTALRDRGLELRVVEDVFWMWRVVDAASLGRKLGLAPSAVQSEEFFFEVLPPADSVYWLADRF
jgi:GNAT superfamily N-acetyltransferase